MTGFGLSLHFLAFSIVPFNSLVLILSVLYHFSQVQGSPFVVNSWSLYKYLPLGRGLASEEVSLGVISGFKVSIHTGGTPGLSEMSSFSVKSVNQYFCECMCVCVCACIRVLISNKVVS